MINPEHSSFDSQFFAVFSRRISSRCPIQRLLPCCKV